MGKRFFFYCLFILIQPLYLKKKVSASWLKKICRRIRTYGTDRLTSYLSIQASEWNLLKYLFIKFFCNDYFKCQSKIMLRQYVFLFYFLSHCLFFFLQSAFQFWDKKLHIFLYKKLVNLRLSFIKTNRWNYYNRGRKLPKW